MTNNIKLGTLVKYSINTSFCLHDVQYDITEFFTKSQIMKNKQLIGMKLINFKTFSANTLYVNVEE